MLRFPSIILLMLSSSLLISACKEEFSHDEFKMRLLGEVNKVRREGCWCGSDSLPPVHDVEWDEALESATDRHLKDMITNNIFDHVGSDGSTPPQRAVDAGFTGAYIGENIARGYITISDVMEQWKSSTSHCKTIMDDHFYFMAVSYDEYHWVQLFGSD